jgi:hypothetical protein
LIANAQSGEIFKIWFFVMSLCWSRPMEAGQILAAAAKARKILSWEPTISLSGWLAIWCAA